MITTTLVVILGALLALVLWQLFKKPAVPATPSRPAEDLANLKITQASTGDTVSVAGAGDDMNDLDFTVDRREQVEAGSRRWVEFSGMYRERRVWLEVRDEDETEVYAVLDPRSLTLEDLGLTEDDLAEIDERQNTADNFEFDGKLWYYRFSKEAKASRDGYGPSRAFYCWQFQEEGGKRRVTIRKQEGEPFAANLSTSIYPGDVTVYRGS